MATQTVLTILLIIAILGLLLSIGFNWAASTFATSYKISGNQSDKDSAKKWAQWAAITNAIVIAILIGGFIAYLVLIKNRKKTFELVKSGATQIGKGAQKVGDSAGDLYSQIAQAAKFSEEGL